MTQPNLELFRRLLMQQAQPARSPVPMIEEGPATSTSSELTPLQRFAGGALYSTYTPYQGDQKRYGYGPQHRFYPTPTQYQGPGTTTATSTGTATYNDGPGENGGPDGGRGQAGNSHPTDLRSFDSFGDYLNDPQVQRDGRALLDMITGVSPSLVGANMVSGGFTGIGPQIPAFGMEDAVADEISQAAAGGGGIEAANAATAEAAQANNDPNTARKGRIVTRANVRPGGKEDGSIQVTVGEGIVRKESMKKIGPRNFKALNAGKFDRALLDAAVDAELAKS